MIYLDHNATTPVLASARDAMLPFLSETWANPSSPYRGGREARAALEQARGTIASCFGCDVAELLFCSSGTEADNLAIRGVASALECKGKHIVTTVIEHHAVLNTCKALEQLGWEITRVPVGRNGVVDPEVAISSFRDDTVLVSVMHANNETGVMQPVSEIAAVARERGILVHSDAVQSIGKIALPLEQLGADLISFSAHKLYGPKGVGCLYVRSGVPLHSVITGGMQERGLRAGTENVAGIVGFSVAVSELHDSIESEAERLRKLRDCLELRLRAEIPEVSINGAGAQRVPTTTSVSFAGVDGESVVVRMDLEGICVSTGSACLTRETEPSHVLRAMGLTPREAQGTIRISIGRETREGHIDRTVRALTKTLDKLRRISGAA